MKKRTVLLILVFVIETMKTFGQIGVGYGNDGHTILMSINSPKKIWGELRVNTRAYNQASWSFSDRGIAQAYVLVNLFTAQSITLYGGAGIGCNIISNDNDKWASVNLPIGLKANPFAKISNFYIFGEYDPMIIPKDDVPVIHCVSFGFRFVLKKAE